jgi:hypothetical protein
MVLSALCNRMNAVFDPDPTHIPSEENAICDALSRWDMSYLAALPPGARAFHDTGPESSLLGLCNPRLTPNSDDELVRQWSLVDQLIAERSHRHV